MQNQWPLRQHLISVLMVSFTASSSWSHVIPFAFYKSDPVPAMSYDFTAMTTLPSDMTLTRASTATYIDSSGVVQIAAVNTARFDYDITTHAGKGLMMEPAATNLLVGSNDLNLTSGTYWNAGGSPMTSTNNTIVAPDGTTTAERFSAPSGISYAIPTLNPATTNGSTYTFSIYAKSTSAGNARIALQEDGGSYTIYAQVVISVTTSWKRYSVTATRASSNPMRTVITMDRGSGDLATMDVWGAQLELGTYASSYIPTTTATVTRAAETASFSNINWFNGTVGTMFAEYVNNDVQNSATYRVFGAFKTNVAGTFAQDSIEISDNNTTVTTNVTNGNTAQFSPGGAVNAAGAINRQAITFFNNNFKSSINRGAVTTDTAGSLPITNYIYVGSQPGGTMRNRYIRKIIYYLDRLSDVQLMAL